MGFMNYCMAVGFLVWALGCWQLIGKAGRPRRIFALWLVLLVLLIFSHPMPLLLLISITFCDLTSLVLIERHVSGKLKPAHFPQYLTFFLTACIAFAVPVLISNKSQIGNEAHDIAFNFNSFRDLVTGAFLPAIGTTKYLYRGTALIALISLPISLFFVFRHLRNRWRRKKFLSSERVFWIILLLILCSVFIPETLNGAPHVADRLWWPLWSIGICCLAGAALSERARLSLTLICCCLAAISSLSTVRTLYSVSRRVAPIDSAPLPREKRGIYLFPASAIDASYGSYSYFHFSGIRAFEHSDSILMNSPWLKETIIPLEASNNSLLFANYSDYYEPPGTAPDILTPYDLTGRLISDPSLRKATLRRVDFIFLIDWGGDARRLVDVTKTILSGDDNSWSCQYSQVYALCQK